MREVDERKRQNSVSSAHDPTQSSSWDLDEESEESSAEADDQDGGDELDMSDQEIEISTPAQRALDYISGRMTPLPSSRPLSPPPRSPPIPFLNAQAMSAFHGYSSPPTNSGGLRPRTGTSTTQQVRTNRPKSLALPSRSISTTAIPTLKDTSSASSANSNLKENRRSSTSVKRLSFTEFAKRLSSTSSLLLVQSNTNASSSSGREGSRRGSSEYGADGDERGLRASVSLRGGASAAVGERDARDKRCGWRGSVGVFGGEGGFL